MNSTCHVLIKMLMFVYVYMHLFKFQLYHVNQTINDVFIFIRNKDKIKKKQLLTKIPTLHGSHCRLHEVLGLVERHLLAARRAL